MFSVCSLLLLLYCSTIFLIAALEIQTQDIQIICYDKSSHCNADGEPKPKVVGVTVGSTLHIWCHYCNNVENFYPRLWFYKPRGRLNWKQAMTEIQTNNLDKHISMTLSHTLILKYFYSNCSGIYMCKSYDSDFVVSYVLDAVTYMRKNTMLGGIRKQQEFVSTYIDSLNKIMHLAEEEPFRTFKINYSITLTIYMVWDTWTDWKEIDGYQKPVRRRLGKCLIHPTIKSIKKAAPITTSYIRVISYFTDGYDVPCRSLQLNDLVPEISLILRKIPDFEEEELCPITSKTVNLKRIKYQVMENVSVVLKCIEGTEISDLKWYKDHKILISIYRNTSDTQEETSDLSIDDNNSLHILHVNKNKEGNYTCSINGQNIKQFEVEVLSKDTLLNQEFIRYSIYLGFVLSLTMTCYCAGVCVAWHRRASFADPLKLYTKKHSDSLNYEQEYLLRCQ